jgi:hypothetical protein
MASKGEFEVVREATMTASRTAVYGLLVDFHKWREWSPWEEIDPAVSRTYSGPDAGVGAVYEWAGNRKAGAGRMEITDAVEPSKVQIAFTSMDKMVGKDFEKGLDRLRAAAVGTST